MNERFTAMAEVFSEMVGRWWWFAASLVALVLWTLFGALVLGRQDPRWFFGGAWNFPLNTVTTVGEWFMECLIAAAAIRVEVRNKRLHELEVRKQVELERIARHTERQAEWEEKLLEALVERAGVGAPRAPDGGA